MSVLPWMIGGGAVALTAYGLTRRALVSSATDSAPHDAEPLPERSSATSASEAVPRETGSLPGRWVWPVGIWQGRKPTVSDGFTGTRRTSSGGIIPHGGLDIMYRRIPSDLYRVGSPNGSRGYVMPNHRAALAASDGIASYAASTPRGWTVIIDHGPRKLATYYTHFSKLLVVPKQEVRAGQPIGIIGGDPLDGAHLMHLHFEIWRGGPKTRFDPAPFMGSWERLLDPGDMPEALLASSTP